MLQEIIRAEHQRGRPGDRLRRHALWEMPANEVRTRQRPITHGAEQ